MVENYSKISGLEGKENIEKIVKYFQSIADGDGQIKEEIVSKNALISWSIRDLSPIICRN